MNPEREERKNRCYIGKINVDAQEGDIWHLFDEFGVKAINMRRGWAIIEFHDDNGATEAIKKLHDYTFMD